jgi:hypothetical protein
VRLLAVDVARVAPAGAAPSGAAPTTAAPTTAAPTTAAPTTAAPTTAAPTTAAPTIAAPTTAAPTGATRVKPGESVALTWTFEARGRVAPGWRMFVHLEGPNRTFVNGDHRPARPFEWWRAGQYIRYTTTVVVPRTATPGRYVVWAGMFEGKRRAKARAPRAKIVDDAVAATEVEVSP